MRHALILFAFAVLTLGASDARAERRIFQDRPCGPGYINLLYPQGFMGADFKPACRRHDRCYGSSTDRRVCDERFFRDLDRACKKSRFKLGCRMQIGLMKAGVRIFGGIARGRDAARRTVRRGTSLFR